MSAINEDDPAKKDPQPAEPVERPGTYTKDQPTWAKPPGVGDDVDR